MSRLVTIIAIAAALSLSSCATKGRSALEDALSIAVKEKKLSEKKKNIILREYEILKDEDREKARTYVEMVERAVEMGGDSTHIDTVRKLAAGERKGS